MSYQLYKTTIAAGVLKFPMNLGFIVENGRAIGKVAIARRTNAETPWDIGFEFNRVDHTIPLYLVIGNDGSVVITEFRKSFFNQTDLTEDVDPVEMDQDLRSCGLGTFEEKGSGAEALKKLFTLE